MKASLLAIDPGNIHSAYVFIGDNHEPLQFDKVANDELLDIIRYNFSVMGAGCPVVIETSTNYGSGMPAGKDIFNTYIWIGRFIEAAGGDAELVIRQTIKTHLCGTPRAKDSNVVQALADRFAPDQPNYGKGTKAEPGWFYGFKADIWQAYALAVYQLDQEGLAA